MALNMTSDPSFLFEIHLYWNYQSCEMCAVWKWLQLITALIAITHEVVFPLNFCQLPEAPLHLRLSGHSGGPARTPSRWLSWTPETGETETPAGQETHVYLSKNSFKKLFIYCLHSLNNIFPILSVLLVNFLLFEKSINRLTVAVLTSTNKMYRYRLRWEDKSHTVCQVIKLSSIFTSDSVSHMSLL